MSANDGLKERATQLVDNLKASAQQVQPASHKLEATDPNLVFEWVKNGQWSKAQFMKWLNAVTVDAFADGVEYNRDTGGFGAI